MHTDNGDIRICFIGDSFINGTSDPECLGWTGRVCSSAMQAGHHVTHYNLGIRRNTSADIAERWLEECQRRLSPECDSRVVFSFGANDTSVEDGQQRVKQATTLRQAARMIEEAKRRYACLWVGPPPVADAEHTARIGLLCAAFQSLARAIDVPYLPVLNPLLESRTWIHQAASGDGAHPQAGGYTELARLIEAWPAWWFRS